MKEKIKTSLCVLAGAVVLATAPMQALHANASEQSHLYNMEEILTPVWEGEISYQESVLPVMRGSGDITIPLLYSATEIIKVQNAGLTITYQEGKDYDVVDGELVVRWKGDIHIMPFEEFYPESSPFKNLEDGGYLSFSEGAYFHNRQIVVTYKHKTKYRKQGIVFAQVTRQANSGKHVGFVRFRGFYFRGGKFFGIQRIERQSVHAYLSAVICGGVKGRVRVKCSKRV